MARLSLDRAMSMHASASQRADHAEERLYIEKERADQEQERADRAEERVAEADSRADKAVAEVAELQDRRMALTQPTPAELQPTQSNATDSIQVLSSLDDRLVAALATGAIRLVRTTWLLAQPQGYRIQTRQQLEQLEDGGESPLLLPDESVSLVLRGKRNAAVLSYGWLSPGSPDPEGARLGIVRATLHNRCHLEGLFWDFMCAMLGRTFSTSTLALPTCAHARPCVASVMQVAVSGCQRREKASTVRRGVGRHG